MTTPAQITEWFRHPHILNDEEREALDAMLQAYPFFVPARYMDAGDWQKENPFSKGMLSTMHLFSGNWLLFNETLHAVDTSGNYQTPVAEPATVHEEAEDDGVVYQDFEPEVEAEEEEEVIEVEHLEDEEMHALSHDPVEDAVLHTHEVEVEGIPFGDDVMLPQGEPIIPDEQQPLITPLYIDDYFRHQGVEVADELPEPEPVQPMPADDEDPKSLMVVMSFSEWLYYFKSKNESDKQEEEDKKALKSMWQKEKLAAAMEEENDEIPEAVFEMAVNSISQEDDLASEPLAEIYLRQGKFDKAIDTYRRLSLRNPAKSAYFAAKINTVIQQKS